MNRPLVALLLLALAASASAREVVITIDDLPRGGDTATARSLDAVRAMTEKLLRPFRDERIPRPTSRAALYTLPQHRERARREYVPHMESVVASFEASATALLGRDFPQILLLHANELNADLMPELLAMFRRRGYTFVTLERALADDAYRLPEEYVGRGGFSWIHRWTRTKGLPIRPEPDPPQWVREAFDAR